MPEGRASSLDLLPLSTVAELIFTGTESPGWPRGPGGWGWAETLLCGQSCVRCPGAWREEEARSCPYKGEHGGREMMATACDESVSQSGRFCIYSAGSQNLRAPIPGRGWRRPKQCGVNSHTTPSSCDAATLWRRVRGPWEFGRTQRAGGPRLWACVQKEEACGSGCSISQQDGGGAHWLRLKA